LFLHLIAMWVTDRDYLRLPGVLQRIGLCFAAAALMALYLSARAQWIAFVALLLGYAALLASGGSYAPFENIAAGSTARCSACMSTRSTPAGAAMIPKAWPRPGRARHHLARFARAALLRRGQVRALLIAGAVCAVAGMLMSYVQPINKNL